MSELHDTVQALEARVRQLEDQLALYGIVSTYGPAMDTGDGEAVGALWADDGVYEYDTSRAAGPDGVAAMAESAGQRALIDKGCAHVLAMPIVRITGDTAQATGYSRVYLHTDDGYEIWRVSANHWEFVRTEKGWRVTLRTNRTLDGSVEARQILQRGLRTGH
jgi:SnoaL-like domain